MPVRKTVFRCLFIFTIFGIAATLIAWNIDAMGMSAEFFAALVLVMAILIISTTLGPVVSDRWKNGKSLSRFRKCVSEDNIVDKQFAQELFAVEYASSFMRWKMTARWSWQSLVDSYAANETVIPTTIASKTHRMQLEAIRLEETLLEPETILISTPQNKAWMSVVMVLLGIQALVAGTHGNYLVMIVSLTILLCAAIQIPVIRDLIPAFRSDFRAPIAGVGFIEDSNRNVWTIDDSLMILSGRTNGNKPVYVHIVGLSGWLLLTYANVMDPEFIKLWKRWNHPDPRPELAS